MGPGRQRKRLLKAARKIPLDQVREALSCRPLELPAYFLLKQHGFEVILSWGNKHSFSELTICDDILAAACTEYLRSLGLVFESAEQAKAYSPPHG